jgi:glutaredoxin
MKTVTFYHSLICPRCALAKLWLAQLLPEFPDVKVERVDILSSRRRAEEAGVRVIPTLVAGDQRASGFILTKGAVRRFLEAI